MGASAGVSRAKINRQRYTVALARTACMMCSARAPRLPRRGPGRLRRVLASIAGALARCGAARMRSPYPIWGWRAVRLQNSAVRRAPITVVGAFTVGGLLQQPTATCVFKKGDDGTQFWGANRVKKKGSAKTGGDASTVVEEKPTALFSAAWLVLTNYQTEKI